MRFLGRHICASLYDGENIETFIYTFKNQLFQAQRHLQSLDSAVFVITSSSLANPNLWSSISHNLKLEQFTSVYIRKWLKIHHSTTNICLYSSTSPCPLPIKSLTSILKAAKVSGHLLLRDSLDPLVNTPVPHLKVGEWEVEDVVNQGEDKIEFEKVLGY